MAAHIYDRASAAHGWLRLEDRRINRRPRGYGRPVRMCSSSFVVPQPTDEKAAE